MIYHQLQAMRRASPLLPVPAAMMVAPAVSSAPPPPASPFAAPAGTLAGLRAELHAGGGGKEGAANDAQAAAAAPRMVRRPPVSPFQGVTSERRSPQRELSPDARQPFAWSMVRCPSGQILHCDILIAAFYRCLPVAIGST